MSDIYNQRNLRRGLEQTRAKEVPGQWGDYTPTYLGQTTPGTTTYSANGQVGRYIRIGNLVIVNGWVSWTAATGTGDVIISLPFTARNATNQFASGSLWTRNVTIGTFSPQMLIDPNTAYFKLWTPANNAASTIVQVEAAGDIAFTAIYEAAP